MSLFPARLNLELSEYFWSRKDKNPPVFYSKQSVVETNVGSPSRHELLGEQSLANQGKDPHL